MEGESLPFFGGKEVKKLYSEKIILERNIEVDTITLSRLKTIERLVGYCQKVDDKIKSEERYGRLTAFKLQKGHLIDDDFLSDEDGENRQLDFNRIFFDIEESNGVHRDLSDRDKINLGDPHGISGEAISRLVALGLYQEPPSFEKAELTDKNPRQVDYIDYEDPDTFNLHYFIVIFSDDGSHSIKKDCLVKINRKFDYSNAIERFEKIKEDHVRQLSEFVKQYGNITVKSFKDDKGGHHHYYKMPINKGLQEIDRRKS